MAADEVEGAAAAVKTESDAVFQVARHLLAGAFDRLLALDALGGLDGDEPVRAFLRDQDREIAEKGGRPPLEIKSIERVGAKKK